MSLFPNLLKISLWDFVRKRKKWLIVSCVVLGLLIGINILINHYVVGVVSDLVKEFVEERSNGFYEVNFEDISYVLNKGRFIMNDFRFGIHNDRVSGLNYDELDQRYIYQAEIPRLHIDITEFWSILFQRRLRVIAVEVDQPFIRVINLNKNKQPKKIKFEAENLYEVLSDHLDELKINDFLIKDGEFDYQTYQGPDHDNFKVQGLTFEVKNFQLNENSVDRKDKIFYMDDIFLEVKSQELYLKDSIHKVMFDKFYISTSDSELGFENFILTRREDPLASEKNNDHYEVTIPNLRISGIDFVGAYNDNALLIDSFHINKPAVSIHQREKIKKSQYGPQKNLPNLAKLYHSYLKIDQFVVDDARVDYFDEKAEKPKSFSVDNISLNISNVEVDSVESTASRHGIDFEKIDLMVKDYEVTLPDSINTLSFSEFSMSSDPLEIVMKDLVFEPSEGFDPAVNTELSIDLPFLSIAGFDIAKAVSEDSFMIDEVYLQRPKIGLIPANGRTASSKKTKPTGFEGIYRGIQSFAEVFSLQKLKVDDGSLTLGHQTRTPSMQAVLSNFDLELTDFYVDQLTDSSQQLLGKTDLRISAQDNMARLNGINLTLGNLAYAALPGRIELEELSIYTDSTGAPNDVLIKMPRLLATGIRPDDIIKEGEIRLDTLQFDEMGIKINLRSDQSDKSIKGKAPTNKLPSISIDHLIGNDYHVLFSKNEHPVFVAEHLDFKLSGLLVDQSLSDNPLNQFDFERVDQISVKNYDLFLPKQNHLFHADLIHWSGSSSEFSIEHIFLSPYNKPNNRYRITVPKITMSGIDLKRVLKESYYVADEIVIADPTINLKLGQGRQKKLASLDLGFIPILLRNRFYGVKASSFNLQNARIKVQQQQEADSMTFEVKDLDLVVDNFEVDSTTEMVPERFLFANDVRLQGDYLTAYYKNKEEFYSVNLLDVSTKTGDIQLNGIYATTNTSNDFTKKGKIRLTTENLFIRDVNFFDLTQKRELKLNEIHLSGMKFHSTPAYDPSEEHQDGQQVAPDSLILNNIARNLQGREIFTTTPTWNLGEEKPEISSDSLIFSRLSKGVKNGLNNSKKDNSASKKLHYGTYLLDTSLLKNIEIDRFLFTDSEVRIDNKEEVDRGLVASDIWLLAEGIKYDPISSEDSSRLFYSDNIVTRISNLNMVLPDNLSSIQVDEVAFNSVDSTLKATNFALMPLVSRYDYGPAKGYQSTWLKLENDSVTLHNADVLGVLNEGVFRASALDVHRLDISVFRDKRNPFPEWQRKPLPQTSLRSMGFTFSLDTVRLHDGYINYQEHAEKAYVLGEIFFSDLDATIINLTNDSVRMLSHPNTLIGANAKVFGTGAVKAEFVFNLVDPENIHSYGVNVDAFDLTEFNRILIPTASVRVTSGKNEKIMMSARANEDYSFGEMKFYYEDLKITLLNRETETPKGIGNVLGSFFANTFIIRSNNPHNLFLRKGDIFFERDKKRAIFNYWTKTFLSGVVSSLGAANNKKKIKNMQEENLKKIQEQKSLEAKH